MEFQQFYLNCLAHASYLVGDGGEAAVVDPQRDVEIYLDEAARRGVKIVAVIETHLHADFVSGHIELARRTGATIYIGAKAGARFPHHAIRDGETLALGGVTLRFLETPGHTPEGVCVVVEEGGRPVSVLTGDTLFIGDVGRPDLSPQHTPQELAGMLYDSLHTKLLTLPDEVTVYPAHGAGSLCGRSMSNELSSTIGIQRRSNYALLAASRQEFVKLLTEDLPERPDYFLADAELNRSGAAPLAELPPLPRLSAEEVAAADATILDTRPATQFLAGHVPGAINIGLSGQFASWAGTLLGVGTKLILVAEDREAEEESRLRLARVGIETVSGVLDGGVLAWQDSGRELAAIEEIAAGEARARQGEAVVLDVRRPAEFEAGHAAGAVSLPLTTLPGAAAALDPAGHYWVQCQGGYRSAIACSLLRRAGFANIQNVIGGWNAWAASEKQ